MAKAFFIDSSGSVVAVAPGEAQGATELGWTPASPKQIAEFQMQEKYGGTLEGTKAFAEHAASAATFGLSDVAERQAGVSPEAMRGREQANPVASGLGTAAGIAVPLLIPGVGEASAPGLVARAGQAVTRGVAEALPEAAGVAGRLAAKALAAGTGSAVEGAAYGLGQVVHEAALGDPNLTAQSALATIGFSAALGGGIAAAGGALAQGAREFGPSDIAGRLKEWLGEFEGERNIKATGAIQSDINRALRTRSRESLTKIGREMGEYNLVGPFSTPSSTYGKAQELIASGAQKARALTDAADAQPGAAKWTFDEIRKEVEPSLAAELRSKGSTYGVAKDLEKHLDNFAEAYAGREMGLTDLHALRQDVDDLIYKHGKTLDPFAKDVAKPLKRIRDYLNDELETGIKDAGLPAADWKQAMREQEVGLTAKRFANAGMTRGHGNNPFGLSSLMGAVAGSAAAGPVAGVASMVGTEMSRRYASGLLGAGAKALREALDSGAVGAVVNKTADALASERAAGLDLISQHGSSAPEAVATLSLLERMNQATANKITTRVAALVRGESGAGIAKAVGTTPDEARAAFAKRTEGVRRLAQNPDLVHGQLTAQTDDWHQHAPNTAQALQVTSARGVAFLASKLPQNAGAGPLSQKWTPTRAETSKFNRYYEAVNRPTSILKQAAAGTLTPEAIEAVATVYPELYAKIRGAIVEKLAGSPKNIPYKSKLMMTMLLGKDLDGTTSPHALMGNMQAFAPPAPPKAAPSRADKLTLASRMRTPMQSSAERK